MAQSLECRYDPREATHHPDGASADAGAARTVLVGTAGPEGASVIPQRVLVLDDNMFIALEAEDLLRALGAQEVHCVSNLPEAFAVVTGTALDFALIDVNVGKLNSFELAGELMRRAIPFAFASGYSDSSLFPEHLRHVPLMSKPFGDDSLRALMVRMFGA